MKRELWLRLHRYRFDDLVPAHLSDRVATMFGGMNASTHAFAGKVARKQGWTTPFALRAITEYKKFVYLGVVAEFRVTPPKVIDAVWHEHLLFTRPYRDFCRNVLGREFDHHPELLPERKQTDVFEAQYGATLALYRAEFNAAPPPDVWGTAKFGTLNGATPSSPPRREAAAMSTGSEPWDDAPLYVFFESSVSGDAHSAGESAFGGGGGFSGGGGGSDWASDSTSDSGSGDGGDSGDGGGSGCSSSCGGE
jgi:uncharacterized membrane protein YgcG